MTRENAKANYQHYIEVGKEEVAEKILEKYPEIEEQETETEEEKTFICPECNKAFETEKGLKIHKAQVHEE